MAFLNGYGGERAFRQVEAQRRSLERKYHSGLQQMLRHLIGILKTRKTPETVISAVEDYGRSKGFQSLVQSMAQRMVTGALAGQKRTWREAAAESMRGWEIYQALKEETGSPAMARTIAQILDENAALGLC